MTYSIAPGDDSDLFAIENDTGIVSIVREVDREVSEMLRATIVAQDGGKLLLLKLCSVCKNELFFCLFM